jgi:hypothetical protein
MKTPYTLSNDYELLWNLIQEGNRLSGWVTVQPSHTDAKIAPRIVSFGLRDDGDYTIGSPGIDYAGHRDHPELNEKEAFIADCTAAGIQYIVPPQALPRIDPAFGASFAKQLLVNLGFVVEWGEALDPVSLSFTEANEATIRTVLRKMMAISPQMREIMARLVHE